MRATMTRIAPERRERPAAAGDAAGRHYRLSQQMLASVVGAIALGLPAVLYLAARFWPTCFRDSISHFYYSPLLGSVFVAALSVIAVFLFAYRGTERVENVLASLAGLAALGVAFLPASGHGCTGDVAFSARPVLSVLPQEAPSAALPLEALAEPVARFALFPGAETAHYLAAFALFLFLLWYCLRIFPAKTTGRQTTAAGTLTATKTLRNLIYYASGTVIAAAIAAMLARFLAAAVFGAAWPWWDAGNWTFWCEAAALAAFGVSWIVKGRVFGTVLRDRADRGGSLAEAV